MSKIIFEKTYHGFEAASDIFRDIHEMFDSRFNPDWTMGGEWQGDLVVTVAYRERGLDE